MKQNNKSRFEVISEQIGKIVTEKNKAYGNSFEESQQFLKILYPNGVPVESYGDMLCIIRIFDKLKRIATNKDAYSESPFSDLVGYGILGVDIDNKRKASLIQNNKSKLLKKLKSEKISEPSFKVMKPKEMSDKIKSARRKKQI